MVNVNAFEKASPNVNGLREGSLIAVPTALIMNQKADHRRQNTNIGFLSL